jgi:multiple sugar transport system permease protein
VRARDLCQLDRLESPSSGKVCRHSELFAALERPKLLEFDEGHAALRAVQYTAPDGHRLVLAALLHRLGRSGALRSIILAPYLIANVIAAILWFWMLDPLLGFCNATLHALGCGTIAFFSDQRLALPTIAAVNIWRHMGFVALLFYTGILGIPVSIYEAARIEGAGPWKSFWYVTLPLLRPTMVFVLVTSVIGSFQVFDSIAVTTLGGPVNSTRAIVW